jgi:CBS domain-containing protein
VTKVVDRTTEAGDDEPRASEIMRTGVPVLTPHDSVALAAARMAQSGLPGLPVLQDGEIVGIVAESDLLVRYADIAPPGFAAFFDWVVHVDAGKPFEEEIRRATALTVRDLMSHPVYSVRDGATLGQIATLMVDRRINPVPVVDESGAFVGIVARADLVRLIAKLEAIGVDDNTSEQDAGTGGGR